MNWDNSSGYFAMERQTQALLIKEHRSVQVLFNVIVSQSFCRDIAVRLPDQNAVEVWGAGTRPWGLRGLAETANMAINTVRAGLKRLARLGLIRFRANTLGTVVQVLKFFNYRRRNENIDRDQPAQQPKWGPPPNVTQSGDTRVSTTAPYRSPSTTSYNILESIVAVAAEPAEPFDEAKRKKGISDLFAKIDDLSAKANGGKKRWWRR
jgi:hypothetical protein